MDFTYLPRLAENEIKRKLRTSGCVLITGPKYCGKSTTAKTFCKTSHSFSTATKIELYSSDIKMALQGEDPILIDEWQNIPRIWDEVRDRIDDRNGDFGQFILTGSVHPSDYEEIIHSGEGRFSEVVMRPFSLLESGESDGKVSLSSLFDKGTRLFAPEGRQTLRDIAQYICRGGWPTSLRVDEEDSLEIASNYVYGIVHYKNREKQNFFPSVETAKLLLMSYARNISSEAPLSIIRQDLSSNRGKKYDDETLNSYLEKLQNLFVISDLPAWNPNLRSKVAIRTTPTRHFIDPSIGAASLGISPDDLLNDMHTFGLFFEDLVVRDLQIYANAMRASVSHYRDGDGLECDAIIHKRNGDWGALEIKLGSPESVEKACKNLLSLKEKIDVDRFKAPSFLGVITGAGPAETREDGIHVFPITMLGI